MLRIVDYAKRCEMEWYELIRLCINQETEMQPLAILTHGELRVFELMMMNCLVTFPVRTQYRWLSRNVKSILHSWPD